MTRRHSALAKLAVVAIAMLVIGLVVAPGVAYAQTTVYDVTFGNETSNKTFSGRTAQNNKISFSSDDAMQIVQAIATSPTNWKSANAFELSVSSQSGTESIKGKDADDQELTLSAPYAITSRTAYTVNVVCDPTQGGSPSANPALARQDATVQLSAPKADGYEFDEWTSSDGVTFANKNAASTTFTMPAKDVTVTAKFKPATYNVTVEGGTTTSTTATYGSTVEITANDPDAGMGFVEWKGPDDVTFARQDAASTTFPMPAKDVTVTAVTKQILIENVTPQEYQYEGNPIEPDFPSLQVSFKGTDLILERGKDFTVDYDNNVHVGEAKLIVTLKSPRTGSNSDTFQITQRPLTITASTVTREYDGTPLDATYEAEGLAEGDSVESATVEGSQTDVGETTSTVKDAKIVNAAGEDVTKDYEITYKPGKLKVTPYSKKVSVKVVGHSATFTYDGKEHEASGYDVTSDVAFYDASNISFKGSASVKGTNVGTYPMVLSANDFSNKSTNFSNVTFKVTDGSLTIQKKKTATLTFDLAGGTLDGKTGKITMEAKIGETVKLPKAPKRDDYTFKYWKGSEYAAGADYKVEGDHTFTATWEKNVTPQTYTITFNANGGSGSMSQVSVTAGKSVTLPTNKYTRSGYTFNGWNTQADGKGTAYKDKDTITPSGKLTLYAQWKKNATTTTKTTNKSATAKTGDASSLVPAAMLAASGATLAIVGRKRRR